MFFLFLMLMGVFITHHFYDEQERPESILVEEVMLEVNIIIGSILTSTIRVILEKLE